MVASIKNQLKNGGKDFIIVKIINSVRTALKLLVLIFLLIKSRFLMPEYSTRINKSPIKPINNGNIKLKNPGRKEVILIEKKEFKNTSIKDIKIKKIPENK